MNDTEPPPHGAGETEAFELENFLPYRLSLLTNTVSEGIARGYRERHDIGVPEWRVIAVLGRFPGLAASEIAERTAMDKVTVSRAVRRLRDNGLLERRPDAADRRRQRLHLTRDGGHEVLQHVVPLARDYEKRLLDALSGKERNLLRSMLGKLQDRALAINQSNGTEFQNRGRANKKGRE
ncbi:MAG: MarR family winged helix-turn-helix transcriptional regulator [Xanthomonadales bacterium]|nr:MarR family winged helix-turn-helix transcriptional regulator [Xanthomonadales bacterium]